MRTEQASGRPGRLDQLDHHDGAQTHDQADGEVDLAEQKGKDLGHRQQDVDAALLEDVDQVLGCQEVGLGDLEGDADDDEPQDHGQDPALAAPHPLPPDVQVLAHRLCQQLRRDFSDHGRGSQVDSGRRGVTRGRDRHRAGQRVAIDPGHHSP